MKIHIVGASCAGSTTLGRALSVRLGFPYFDTDDYFWEPSYPLFTIRRNPDERSHMIQEDLAKHSNWILGGSVINWGPEWPSIFDLVIFLYVPREIRMQRLKNREFQIYGNSLFTDENVASRYRTFINWAHGYDDNTTNGRNLKAHESWLKQLKCPVININGDFTVRERLEIILSSFTNL